MANKRKRYEEKAPPHAPFDAVERRRAPGRWVACLAPFGKEARLQHPLSSHLLFVINASALSIPSRNASSSGSLRPSDTLSVMSSCRISIVARPVSGAAAVTRILVPVQCLMVVRCRGMRFFRPVFPNLVATEIIGFHHHPPARRATATTHLEVPAYTIERGAGEDCPNCAAEPHRIDCHDSRDGLLSGDNDTYQ